MGGGGAGGGGGVGGILLDSSVILDSTSNDNETTSLRTGADYLLRKLRHSNIPTGISYAVGLSEAKVSLLEKLICAYSFEHFIYNPSSLDDTINAVSLAWENNGTIILHVVSNYNEELVPKSFNSGWMNVIVNVDGDDASKNPTGIFIEKLEELPLTICELNRKSSEDNLVVGYIMKPSREEDFAKRGAFPLNPTQNGLIFLPLTFDLPILTQLKKVDIVIHKATDEISSIERSNHNSKIIYTRGMLELQRCICELSDCCVIDPFDNVFPVVDRLRIQEILLGLEDLKTKSQCKIRGPYFLKVDNFEDLELEQRLHRAKLSLPSIVKPQVACGVADAHSMAIVFKAADFTGLSVPLPAIVQEYVDHSSTLFKFYVLGEKVFYAVKNSTPNAHVLKNSSEKNGFKPLLFDSLKSLPTDGNKKPSGIGDYHKLKEQQDLDIGLVTDAANYLRRVLDLTIFGFDVVIQEGTRDHVIVDVNYLPSFKEVPNETAIPAFWDAIKMKYESKKAENG